MLESCDERSYVWQTNGSEKRKVMYSAGEIRTEIDFVLVGKGNKNI